MELPASKAHGNDDVQHTSSCRDRGAMMPRMYVLTLIAAVGLGTVSSPSSAAQGIQVAAGPANDKGAQGQAAEKAGKEDEKELTPEQKMLKRFPQPVRIGDLIGLAVLDDADSTIGYVRDVVRSSDGKIFLIVPYSAWFGWAPVNWGKRPIAMPIETVAILARQLNALDMARDEFDEADTWTPDKGKSISRDEKTLISLGRR